MFNRPRLCELMRARGNYRSPEALGPAYEQPENVTDEDIETYFRPLVRSDQRTRDLQRFVAAFDNEHTVNIEPQLRELRWTACEVSETYLDREGRARRVISRGAAAALGRFALVRG